MNFQQIYQAAIENPKKFWQEQAEKIHWFKKPTQILEPTEYGSHQWFVDGTLNTSFLCLDIHVQKGQGDRPAIYYDSPVTQTKRTYSYAQLLEQTEIFAGALKRAGLKKGDGVIIYMPMVPETMVAMLACARIGVVHSVVFGGFAPHELAMRINDLQAKLIITASCGIEIDKIVPYVDIVEKALQESKQELSKIVLLERPQLKVTLPSPKYVLWEDFIQGAEKAPPVELPATHPLYVLYTSGTTAKPKGVIRQNGGHAVALKFSMDAVYDARPGEAYWAASDIGWVVGHSYIVYAPLIQGLTTVLFEGKPVKTPDAGTFWRVVQEYQVKTLFSSPTAFRAIKKEDPQGLLAKKYDLSCLRNVFVAGERLDPPTQEWLNNLFDCPIYDHWWQTETGWPITAFPAGIEKIAPKIGSSGLPMPGYKVAVLNDEGQPTKPGEKGKVFIKLPLPPGCLHNLWHATERFKKSYLDAMPGYYYSGDGGYFDEQGYLTILGRVDEVINVAGHRLSTGEMEEVIAANAAVAECAVISVNDSLKGQLPVAMLLLKDGEQKTEEQIASELISEVRNQIGPIACFRTALFVKRLPKTRSGKILRGTMSTLANEGAVDTPSTIDDPKILDEIKDQMIANKIGFWSAD